MKSDMAFLKRCRDLSIIPFFAEIKHQLNNSKNYHVFLNASLALVRFEIYRVRKGLDFLSRKLFSLHLELPHVMSTTLWARVEACLALKPLHLEEIWKNKQSRKFLKLAKISSSLGSLSKLSGYSSSD